MRSNFLRLVTTISILACCHTGTAASAKLPSWLKDAIENKDAYDRFEKAAKGLVLHSSIHETYKGRGVVETVQRKAIHLKTRDYREHASAAISLANSTQRITDFDAWMIYPSGKIETFRKRDLVTIAQSQDALFSEAQSMVLDRSYSARDDTVFAFEYKLSEKSIFLQTSWTFHDSMPILYSKISVTLPKGWEAEGHHMNSDQILSSQTGQTFTWIARDLPGIEDEPSRPPALQLFAKTGITITPSAKDLKSEKISVFETWKDVAAYGGEVQEEALAANSAMRQKAEELVAGKTSLWEKIKAICEYTQSVNYVAVKFDLNSGGGYKPRPASFVFEKHYGDCKDMTALTRSLLSCVDIDAFPTLASVGNETYVHDQWPSPAQFNHCIVAIPVPIDIKLPAVITHPELGPTLIFDPTERFTPVGQMPHSLQGTKVLISDPSTTALTPLPLATKEEDGIIRTIDVAITPTGKMEGQITELCRGSIADSLRALNRSTSELDFKKIMQAYIASGTREATINTAEVVDNFEENTLSLTLTFEADKYARAIGRERILIPPVFLNRRDWVPPEDKERKSNYMTFAWTLDETIRIQYPDNFVFDAAPPPFEKESTFGAYAIENEPKDNAITVRRKLSISNEVIPPNRYPDVVDFYEKASRADSRPIVLKIAP